MQEGSILLANILRGVGQWYVCVCVYVGGVCVEGGGREISEVHLSNEVYITECDYRFVPLDMYSCNKHSLYNYRQSQSKTEKQY